MTVQQLIKVLSQIKDQQTWVMVKGYEGGYKDVQSINSEPIDIAIGVNNKWYYGAHEKVDNELTETGKQYQIVKAIIIT